MQSWQNPGIKAVLAKCKTPPKPKSHRSSGLPERGFRKILLRRNSFGIARVMTRAPATRPRGTPAG